MPRKPSTLTIAVVGTEGRRTRCQAILTRAEGVRVIRRNASVASAPRLLRRHQPHVLLLDAVGSPLRALGVLPVLRRLSPATGVILLSRDGTSPAAALEGLRRGAAGYVTERDLPSWLEKAVRTVAAKEAWVPRRLGAAIVAELRAVHRASSRRRRTRLSLRRGGRARVGGPAWLCHAVTDR